MGGVLTMSMAVGEECGCVTPAFAHSHSECVMITDIVGGAVYLGAIVPVVYNYTVQQSEQVTLAVMELHCPRERETVDINV